MDVFKKVLEICKKNKTFISYRDSQTTQWLGDGSAFYLLHENREFKPEFLTAAAKLNENDLLGTFFGKERLSKTFELTDMASHEEICRVSLIDLVIDNKKYKVVFTIDGARLIDADYIIWDELEYEVYFRVFEGRKYFVIKQGMCICAIIKDDKAGLIKAEHGRIDQMAKQFTVSYKKLEGEDESE